LDSRRSVQDIVSLRPATPADESFLLRVYSSTRSAELKEVGWNDSQIQVFCETQFTAQTRCYPAGDNRVILLNELPVGRMLVETTEDAILLVDIAILTPYRNSGIGTCLIKDLLKKAVAAKKPVRLHVLTSSPAVRLYKRLGFLITGGDSTRFEMTFTGPEF
jgi:ribosomal protein S18 acetylase RimI-like enzyme